MPGVQDAKIEDLSCEQCRCGLQFTCNYQNNMHTDKLLAMYALKNSSNRNLSADSSLHVKNFTFQCKRCSEIIGDIDSSKIN